MPAKKKSKRKPAKPKAAKKKSSAAHTKRAARTKSGGKKKSARASRRGESETQNRDWSRTTISSARQSGDLQGLSRAERASSQSVDELVEEGNVFEAEAVAGVEEADDADEQEVHTHEVPEDDVPGEYLDDK